MLPEEQQRINKKPNQINRLNDEKPRKAPKFSIYWIYAIIIAILLGTQLFKSESNVSKTDERTFKEEMYLKGDVDKVEEIVNKRLVRVYIKQASLSKTYYQTKLKKAVGY